MFGFDFRARTRGSFGVDSQPGIPERILSKNVDTIYVVRAPSRFSTHETERTRRDALCSGLL